MNRILIVVLFTFFCSSCQHSINETCARAENENYTEFPQDSALYRKAIWYKDLLLARFKATQEFHPEAETYRLYYYSVHGYGKIIEFTKKNNYYFLNRKSISKKGFAEYGKDYKKGISKNDWNALEDRIYECNFWTERPIKQQKQVLDGTIYLLEGFRPEAKICNKRTYHFVGRTNLKNERIGNLCRYIIQLEEKLANKKVQ